MSVAIRDSALKTSSCQASYARGRWPMRGCLCSRLADEQRCRRRPGGSGVIKRRGSPDRRFFAVIDGKSLESSRASAATTSPGPPSWYRCGWRPRCAAAGGAGAGRGGVRVGARPWMPRGALSVNIGNEDAIALYRRCGFHQRGAPRPFEPRPGGGRSTWFGSSIPPDATSDRQPVWPPTASPCRYRATTPWPPGCDVLGHAPGG